VGGAALFLSVLLLLRGSRLPRDPRIWTMLFVQAIFNSIGAWTVLAWGQQFVPVLLSMTIPRQDTNASVIIEL
jgi:uncharacterized membrane protein YfcA